MDDTNEESISEIGSIWRVFIDGKYRGYGIATKLMNAS
jgi:ribosomal protein S18 acetylase RimI-like enzyme